MKNLVSKLRSVCIICAIVFSCSLSAQNLVDKNAEPETLALYENLSRLAPDHILFGHQDALAYGEICLWIDKTMTVKSVATLAYTYSLYDGFLSVSVPKSQPICKGYGNN